MGSINSFIVKPNTDISKVKMVTKRCQGCGMPLKVSKDSKTKFHSRVCAELPSVYRNLNTEQSKQVADSFDTEIFRIKKRKPENALINQIPISWQKERRDQKVEEK